MGILKRFEGWLSGDRTVIVSAPCSPDRHRIITRTERRAIAAAALEREKAQPPRTHRATSTPASGQQLNAVVVEMAQEMQRRDAEADRLRDIIDMLNAEIRHRNQQLDALATENQRLHEMLTPLQPGERRDNGFYFYQRPAQESVQPVEHPAVEQPVTQPVTPATFSRDTERFAHLEWR